MKTFTLTVGLFLATFSLPNAALAAKNVVLILFDDMSPRVGAFGDPVAHTPVLDALAKESIRYPNAFATSPVCAPSRSVLLTGVHQQTLGTIHMRTGDGNGGVAYEAVIPAEVKAFPELLRAQGYYTITLGKTDYQFGTPFSLWDRYIPNEWNKNNTVANWKRDGISHLNKDRSFFAYINLHLTHESFSLPKDMQPVKNHPYSEGLLNSVRQALEHEPTITLPGEIKVPAYLPDTPTVRATMARMYDNISFDEKNPEEILQSFKSAGLLDNTIVIVTADQGSGLMREKAYIYDAGLRVPLMVRFPDGRGADTVDRRLTSLIDIAPTILSLAGVPLPRFVQGHSFLDPAVTNSYVFGAGDREDELPERMKTAIDGRYQYIRNYRTDLPLFRMSEWYEAFPLPVEYFALWHEGNVTPEQRYYFEAPRQPEELYDLKSDPYEMKNRADDAPLGPALRRMRQAMDRWISLTGDLSAIPEKDLVEKMWPGLKQPRTAAPNIKLLRRGGSFMAVLFSSTPGASIGYSFDEPPRPTDPKEMTLPLGMPDTLETRAYLAKAADAAANSDIWQLYTKPIVIRSDRKLWAKAIRYGYQESEVVAPSP